MAQNAQVDDDDALAETRRLGERNPRIAKTLPQVNCLPATQLLLLFREAVGPWQDNLGLFCDPDQWQVSFATL